MGPYWYMLNSLLGLKAKIVTDACAKFKYETGWLKDYQPNKTWTKLGFKPNNNTNNNNNSVT